MELTEQQRARIEERLRGLGALGPCPICGNPQRGVPPYLARQITQDAQHAVDLAHGLPCAITICDHCGFSANHALNQIGLPAKDL